MTSPATVDAEAALVLVTSAERLLLARDHTSPHAALRMLPLPLPAQAASTVAWVREHLAGEISGLRLVAADGPTQLWAARVVGRAPARWRTVSTDATWDVVEVSLDEARVGEAVEPDAVGRLLRAVVTSRWPLEMLLGLHAAAR